jgi:putative FmdB family regulatory protein
VSGTDSHRAGNGGSEEGSERQHQNDGAGSMPTYEYLCEKCDHEFEREQRMSDPPVKTCPQCRSRKVKKLISRTSFVLKGSGWYSDLYSSSKKDDKKGGDSESTSDSGSSSASSDEKSSDKKSSDEKSSDEKPSDKKSSSKSSESGKTSKSKSESSKAGNKSAA